MNRELVIGRLRALAKTGQVWNVIYDDGSHIYSVLRNPNEIISLECLGFNTEQALDDFFDLLLWDRINQIEIYLSIYKLMNKEISEVITQ